MLRVEARSPRVDTARFGEVPALDVTATYDEPTGDVVRLRGQPQHRTSRSPVEVDLRALVARHGTYAVAEHHTIADDDLTATNTAEQPDRVVPRAGSDVRVEAASARVLLPPVSWSAVRLSPTARLSKGAR